MQAAYFIVVARLLGAGEYGAYAGAFAFTGVFAQYCTLGTGTVFLRYVAGNPSAFGKYWGNVLLVTATVSTLVISILCLVGPQLLNKASAALILWAAIANCFCAQLIAEIARVFQTFHKMKVTALLQLSTNFARSLMAVGMLVTIHRATAWQWTIASTAISAAALVVSIILVTSYFGRPAVDYRLFAKHGIEGLEYTFASSTTAAYNDVDKIMMSHYGMNQGNGIYIMAYRVLEIGTIPIYSIKDAAIPRLFELGRGGLGAMVDLANNLSRRAFAVSCAVAIGIFLSSPIVPMIAGPGFSDTAVALRWLCLIPVFRSVHIMTGTTLTCAGFQRFRTTSQFTAAILNFGINLWLIPHYGWRGAAWASLITDGALSIINWTILKLLIIRSKSDKQSLKSDEVLVKN
jgi:O-antigen/teichoic acid export membrane protein